MKKEAKKTKTKKKISRLFYVRERVPPRTHTHTHTRLPETVR